MRNFSVPGVTRQEIDLSEIMVPTGTSNGAVVIHSKKGAVNRPVLITNNKEFIETFGEPIFTSGISNTESGKLTPEYGYGSYAALEFLKESSNLYVVRSFSDNDKYAEIDISGIGDLSFVIDSSGISGTNFEVGDRLDTKSYISILDDYATTGATGSLVIGSIGMGTEGNHIAVTIEPFNLSADWKLNYDEYPTMTTSAFYYNSATYATVNIASPLVSALSEGVITSVSGFPIACKVAKINVFVKQSTVEWESYFRTDSDRLNGALYINPVETYYGSLSEDLRDGNNNNLFIENVINGNSKYIYVKKGASVTADFPIVSSTSTDMIPYGISGTDQYIKYNNTLIGTSANRLMILSGGESDTTPNLNDTGAWAIFEDRNNTNVNILIGTSLDTSYKQELARIASVRADAIAVLQTGSLTDDKPEDIISSEDYGYRTPSYVSLYAGYSKIKDTYNDKNVLIPDSVLAAAVYARVDNIGYSWDAPAGTNRAILSVIDKRKIFSDNEIGQLYDRNINSSKFIRGSGHFLWGQKTAQTKASSLDRINVRRNLLYIETNIERSLLQFCFENNTAQTRLRVFSIVDAFLGSIYAAGGLIKYECVVDGSNNPPEIIDANRMNVDIYVQPAKTIEYIRLSTVITRSGISFDTVRIANL